MSVNNPGLMTLNNHRQKTAVQADEVVEGLDAPVDNRGLLLVDTRPVLLLASSRR